MSIYFFLFILTCFLFFTANVVLSKERNPFYNQMLEKAGAPTQPRVEILAYALDALAVIVMLFLIGAVPFFRIVAALAMAYITMHFLYRLARPKTNGWGISEEEYATSPIGQVDAAAAAGNGTKKPAESQPGEAT